MRTEEEAKSLARHLLLTKFPKRKGWKSSVWCNIGWHISFSKGSFCTVYYEEKEDRFSCIMGHIHSGIPNWSNSFYDKDPIRVIRRALKVAQEDVAKRVTRFNHIRESVGQVHINFN